MAELLLSEITRMSDGFCVIGLERNGEHFRSLRPLPRRGYAWRSFPYRRADKVAFEFLAAVAIPPHTEDRGTANDRKVGFVSESELVGSLRQAEVAPSVKGMFGCDVHVSRRGGEAIYVVPAEATRSICGCDIASIRFTFHFYPKIRATVVLKSGERLESLPLVDADWTEFINVLAEQMDDPVRIRSRLDGLFKSLVYPQIQSSPFRFVRIGLCRPDREGLCWFMLDSLFPLPKKSWLE
ncbi:MAG TPA: hypothetical protein VKA02_01385 [Candidatus Acidoferrum sp.]|nr:hypothetical protein [Candidatus Acidoferrum sp.]